MASPAFQTSTTLAASNQTGTVTIAVPASVATDDVLVIAVYRENSNVITITGFTAKDTASPTNHKLSVFWKRATGADSGTYSLSLGAGTVWTTAACLRISGCVASGDPFDTTTTAIDNTITTGTPAVSLTTSSIDTLLVFAGTNFGGGAWTPPASMTERTDISDDLETATLAQAAAGATGSKTASVAGGGGSSSAWLGALLPIGGAAAYVRPTLLVSSAAVVRAGSW